MATKKPKVLKTSTISMHDIRDMLGWPWCWDWMQFCEDNKGKYNDDEMLKKYNESKLLPPLSW